MAPSASSVASTLEFPKSETEVANAPTSPGTSDKSVFVFPATLAQNRFWLLDQLQPGGNPALNMSIGLHWRGPVDVEALQRALREVVARHEALRTTFASDHGQLQQLIAPTLSIDLSLGEILESGDLLAGDRAARLLEAEAQQPFDLARGPLIRTRLVRLGAAESLLLVTVHHIVSDGWSNGIVLRDLGFFYSAFVEGRPPDLPALSLQFADYADWQQARLSEDDFAAQRSYWQGQLGGELPALDLPFDRPRRAGMENLGAVRSSPLTPEIARAVKGLATAENASAFMVYVAVFQTLLHRYTGQVDFLVTTPSANRERREFEALVGLFVNPLLLRADLRGAPSFRDLMQRVRTVALEAFAHQDIPFESLLDELRVARLQVNFHYDPGLQPRLTWARGLTSETLPAVSPGTIYDLSLSVLEGADGPRVEIEYNAALFEAETIERMLGHYQTLLQSALVDAAQPIATLALLSPTETHPRDQGDPDAPTQLDIRTPLVDRVMSQPDAVVARHGRRELSCAELLARVEAARTIETDGPIPTDLDQAAAWVDYWRARVGTPPPAVRASDAEREASLTAASLALLGLSQCAELERVVSCSPPGLGAIEEVGAALLANTVLVYPTADLMADSPAAFTAWLETENISVAYLPAAMWHRLHAWVAARRTRLPAKLRLVIVTEGEPNEGSFGRVTTTTENDVRICRRVVLPLAGGTITLDDELILPSASRLEVRDVRSQPLPIGIVGELTVAETGMGELGRRMPNDMIERLGPADKQPSVGGVRHDWRRTEAALCASSGVRHALVQSSDEAVIAYILADPSGEALPSDGNLRQPLREQGLPDFAIPQSFVLLKDIPIRSDNGQLDLAALAQLRGGGFSGTPEPVRPYLGLQLQLIAIWEEVLGVRGIGIRDDFFELGGNSLLAMRMLHRAENACGKVILPAALFRHPTIEHLAGEIAREARDESPELLRVHDAGTRTPFFYLHGDLSGGGFYSLKLSRALGPDQPFYVLPPQDIRALPAAPSIQEMAAAHLQALRAVRPKGPYVIGGFCIGGLVAFELAQQIKSLGEKVEMLLIIDAAPDRTLRTLRWLADAAGKFLRWDGEARVAHFGRWAIWRARLALRFAPKKPNERRAPARTLTDRWNAMRGFVSRRLRNATTEPVAAPIHPEVPVDRDLPSAFRWASASYQPATYDGPVALLLSEDVLDRADNVSRAWQQLAPEVTVRPLRGSHLECITAHVEALAEKIEECLSGPGASSTR